MTSTFHSLWSSGDSSGLLRLARDIEAHESWRGFLTIQEHDIFKYAIDLGGRVWHEFINGNATCRMEQPSDTTTSPSAAIPTATPAPGRVEKSPFTNGYISATPPVPSPSPLPAEPTEPVYEKPAQAEPLQLDSVSVAFRVRYMLYEKSIGLIFPSLDPAISADIDYAIFEEEETPTAPAPAPRKADDDDYDDDDEDDEKEEEKKPDVLIVESDSSGKPIILSMSY